MDSYFWNKMYLEPPEIIALPILSEKTGPVSKNLANIFEKMLSVLEKQPYLHQEAALLSRLIYRMKRKFIKDKGFKGMQKVNKCLRQYLQLDFVSTVASLNTSVYEKNGPSREMLEWCLVRLQAFGALFKRCVAICLDAARYLNMRLRDGHFWDVAMICTAILSRIWTISSYLTTKSCEWYRSLKPFLTQLASCHCKWLPDGYVLPEKLELWLGEPDLINPMEESVLIQDSKTEKNDVKNDQCNTNISKLFEGPIFREDLGETVSRENFLPLPLNGITSHKRLLNFMSKERMMRKSNLNECYSRKMNNVKWKELQDYVYSSVSEIRTARDTKQINKMLKKVLTNISKKCAG